MDYEKKYKEALEKARFFYGNCPTEQEKKKMETIFPELTESEDEKIRKHIIEILERLSPLNFDGNEKGQCIAYLEKQKELFESGRGLYYYDGEKTTYCGFITEENPYDFAISQQEKQKEPLTPLAKALSNYLKNDFEFFARKEWNEAKWNEVMNTQAMELQRLAYLEKQKPSAPNKYDEKMRKKIIDHLESIKMGGVICTIDTSEEIAWLEKQKVRGPLTKEEEFTLQRIIEYLEDEGCPTKWKDLLHDIYILPYERQKEQKPTPSRETILGIWELGNLWKENPEKREGLSQLEYIQKYWAEKCDYLIEQKPAEYLNKDKVYAIMTKLTNLSYSQLIPINSDEFKKLHEITCDVRSLLDYPIEQKPAEWSEEDEGKLKAICTYLRDYPRLAKLGDKLRFNEYCDFLKSLRPQPRKEIYQAAKHDLAIKFMNYLDENRPEGKMSLSNGECEDIDKAFKENDWAKIMRYIEKYSSHWKPSEMQLEALDNARHNGRHYLLDSLYNDLKKL